MLQIALLIIGGLVFIAVLTSLADNLIQIEAKKSGIDTVNTNMSIWPSFGSLFKPATPNFTTASNFHKLRKGHDIKLEGQPEGSVDSNMVSRYSVRPQNFRGNAPIPKMLVEVGSEVKAGEPLFFDKQSPDIKYVAPVSGEVIEIRRGAKRSIVDVVILADKDQKHHLSDTPNLSDISREDLIKYLQSSGAWSMLVQRPFGLVADPSITPRDIFVSAFDTGPLAPDPSLALTGRSGDLQEGINVLSKLTDGQVYLSGNKAISTHLSGVDNADIHYFDGPHPAGNVGIQIHHIKPIKGADVVWTMSIDDVLTLGNLVTTGKYEPRRIVSIGGKVKQPKYVETLQGANVGELLSNQLEEDNIRIIAGDILSGKAVTNDDFLNANDDQITVIKEGNYNEPFGWLLPIKPRPSVSNTFPNFLFPDLTFDVDSNTHGEERAFVVTGQYEKMLPMDIYPQHLMKAIMTGNIERMEGLGINELLEEDIALAEFSCTSKQPLQSILRDGLDMLREQL